MDPVTKLIVAAANRLVVRAFLGANEREPVQRLRRTDRICSHAAYGYCGACARPMAPKYIAWPKGTTPFRPFEGLEMLLSDDRKTLRDVRFTIHGSR